MKVAFGTKLDVREVGYIEDAVINYIFQLRNPLYVTVDDPAYDFDIEIVVPALFTTDFCSVPRIPFAYLMFGNIGNKAGVTHDALYSNWSKIRVVNKHTGEPFHVTRKWADEVLRAALLTCGIVPYKAEAMYLAVRTAGSQYYRKGGRLEHGVEH